MTSVAATAAGRLEQIGAALAELPGGGFCGGGRAFAGGFGLSERADFDRAVRGGGRFGGVESGDPEQGAWWRRIRRPSKVCRRQFGPDAVSSYRCGNQRGGARGRCLPAGEGGDFSDFSDTQSSFVFAAVELTDNSYPRGRYARLYPGNQQAVSGAGGGTVSDGGGPADFGLCPTGGRTGGIRSGRCWAASFCCGK